MGDWQDSFAVKSTLWLLNSAVDSENTREQCTPFFDSLHPSDREACDGSPSYDQWLRGE
jgi:hypothetical protein